MNLLTKSVVVAICIAMFTALWMVQVYTQGDADVSRKRNLQYFEMERTMGIDVTRLRNYQSLELMRTMGIDVTKLRNHEYFELIRTMNADVIKSRNLQYFEMTIPPHEYEINITSLVTTDQNGNPKSNFTHGDMVHFDFTIENLGNIPLAQGLASTMVLDPSDIPVFLSYIFEDLPVGQSREFVIGYKIPMGAAAGTYTVKVVVFTDRPSKGGFMLDTRTSAFTVG